MVTLFIVNSSPAFSSNIVAEKPPKLLTEPYLQNPTAYGVYVAWVTNFPGENHAVIVSVSATTSQSTTDQTITAPTNRQFQAASKPLNRLLEDSKSKIIDAPSQVEQRQVFRHEAYIDGLQPGKRYRYWIKSIAANEQEFTAGPFQLQALPATGAPLQILLTSDQQEKFNTLANYQTVATMFPKLDAVFFAGDLVNHPRRASEWFDNVLPEWLDNPLSASPSFFPAMQGTFQQQVPTSPFCGGQILQNTPIFPAVANHEVSGRYRPNAVLTVAGEKVVADINTMFADAQPLWFAQYRYEKIAQQINPDADPEIKAQWLRDNSNDFESYRALFNVPDDGPEGESYYAKQVGDVFLIALNVSRIWRGWEFDSKSKFSEHPLDLNNPEAWGFGEHLFTPFAKGSQQYRWLQEVLRSEAFKRSRYRVVMFHQSASGLGDNTVPVLTDPAMFVDYRSTQGGISARAIKMPLDAAGRARVWRQQVQPLLGSIVAVRYQYPIEEDYFQRDIEPLLMKAGVQLVLHGHSHIWNRTRVGKLHYLETSSAGNCFGAYWAKPDGSVWHNAQRGKEAFFNEAEARGYALADYPRSNDPHARQPIMPNLANPMMLFAAEPEPLPFVCDNAISTFSILDTTMGAVRSFAIPVNNQGSEVIEFDRFRLD